MSVSVVEKRAGSTSTEADVVLQANTIQELQTREADQLALKTAVELGLARPGISTTNGPYPVDANGETSDAVAVGRTFVVGYRREYRILSAA
jgi:hypothetical protein